MRINAIKLHWKIMTQPATKLATDKALGQLMQFSNSGEYSPMDLKRIEREVTGLLENGRAIPAQAQMIFGVIGFLSGDRAKAESGFRNALKLSSDDAVIYINGITGLSSLGNFSESLNLIRILLDRFPDDKRALASTMILAEQAMQYQLVRSIIDRYDKLSANGDTQNISIFRSTMNRSLQAFENSALSDDDLLARLEVATEAIRSCGLELRRTSTFTLYDGSVIYNMYLTADSSTCADINFKVADALMESFEDTGMEYFSILCRPYSDFPEVRARREN